MRICIIGKFPPIQGGVSMRTYRTAHALAARGHEVHVVTNAREAAPPFRMLMRPEDWVRCEASGSGSVQVHWTDPVDRTQSFLPMASPFVSKLASIAARVHAAHPFDVILSHYLEPYGVAGHLAAQMTGAPHVVRMAGSDAGRLWHHPQLEPLYDHVLRCAETVVATGTVAERAALRGVDRGRIVPGGGFALPEDDFAPEGAALDFGGLKKEIEREPALGDMLWGGFAGDTPHFGVYGKLGDNKGSFALLAAMHRLKMDGLEIGLVAMAHGRPEIETRFRERARELSLFDRILQIPFLPHWRVPEFLRGCLAVCCLEQDFPIGFHSPIVPFEVLLSGACLVASTEVIRKLPQWQRLPHGYGCVAIKDVNDVSELSGKLAAIVLKPAPAVVVGARGRAFALDCQAGVEFPDRLERILRAAAARQTFPVVASPASAVRAPAGRFRLTQMVAAGLRQARSDCAPDGTSDADDLASARKTLVALHQAIAGGRPELRSHAQAVETEIAIAEAESQSDPLVGAPADPLFRLGIGEWALEDGGWGGLVPLRDAHARVLRFAHDVSRLLQVETLADLPTSVGPGPSHVVVFGDTAREPLVIDRFTARILELSDGTRTGNEIVRKLDREFGRAPSPGHLPWFENLLLSGLIGLRDANTRGRRQAS